MRVGFLVSSVSREAGGLFQSVRGLAKALVSTTSNICVFGISDEQTAVDLQEWRPLSVQVFRPRLRAWGYSNELVPAMVGADLDVLSVHGLWKYCSVGSQRWHRQTGRPYVVHPHGMLEPWALRNAKRKKQIAALLYENEHLRRAACLCALSEAEAESMRAYGLRNPICVIPNGVDLPEQPDRSATKANSRPFGEFTKDRKILLYLGRLHPKKNLANLIRAWNDSQRWRSDSWVLAIAGWDRVDTKANSSVSQLPLRSFFSARNSVRKKANAIARATHSRPAFAKRRPADDRAGSMGPCKTGAYDTGMQSAGGFLGRSGVANWIESAGNCHRLEPTHRNE